jgi:hypothetical protein
VWHVTRESIFVPFPEWRVTRACTKWTHLIRPTIWRNFAIICFHSAYRSFAPPFGGTSGALVGRFTWRQIHRLTMWIWWGVSPVWSLKLAPQRMWETDGKPHIVTIGSDGANFSQSRQVLSKIMLWRFIRKWAKII